MSVGPSVLGSLREGSCSLANLLADNENKPSPVKLKQLEEKRDQRRASVMRGKGEFDNPGST